MRPPAKKWHFTYRCERRITLSASSALRQKPAVDSGRGNGLLIGKSVLAARSGSIKVWEVSQTGKVFSRSADS